MIDHLIHDCPLCSKPAQVCIWVAERIICCACLFALVRAAFDPPKETITLPAEDFDRLAEAIENPKPPNEALKASFKARRK